MDNFNRMLARFEPQVLSIFRIITGLLLFQFAAAKLLKIPVVAPFDKVEAFSLFGVAGMFELVFGALLIVGLFSRCAAFILCGEMAFAYFLGHMFKNPAEPVFLPLLNNGSLAILLCFACLYLATSGGGPISVDGMRQKS